MAAPKFFMKDKYIEEIQRIEGLLAYAVKHSDAEEARRLAAILDKLVSKED